MTNTFYRYEDYREHLALLRKISQSNLRAKDATFARLDYLEQRLAAIEAQLGITPPPPPPEVAADPISALDGMVSQSGDDDLAALESQADAAGIPSPPSGPAP